MNLNRAIEAGLAGVVPVYEPFHGNVTKVVTVSGDETIVNRTAKSVLRRLARHYGVDIKAVKAKYARSIGHYKGIPLAMAPELILISVKVREPLVRGDGGLAYINLRCIKSFRADNTQGVNILLKNGITLKGLCSSATFQKHMRWGELVYRLYMKNQGNTCMMLEDSTENYLKPATRADIAMLVKEILEIKGRLP